MPADWRKSMRQNAKRPGRKQLGTGINWHRFRAKPLSRFEDYFASRFPNRDILIAPPLD